jgi:hypothetical protein
VRVARGGRALVLLAVAALLLGHALHAVPGGLVQSSRTMVIGAMPSVSTEAGHGGPSDPSPDRHSRPHGLLLEVCAIAVIAVAASWAGLRVTRRPVPSPDRRRGLAGPPPEVPPPRLLLAL